jgi:hypothetical protein
VEPKKPSINPAMTVAVENMQHAVKAREVREAFWPTSNRKYINRPEILFDSHSALLENIKHLRFRSAASSINTCSSSHLLTISNTDTHINFLKMSGASFEYATGTLAPPELTPLANDTYDWATIQKSRPAVKLLQATADSLLPPFVQKIPYGKKGTLVNSTFKVEASPKWFSIVSSEMNDQGQMVVTLGVQAGKTLAAGKVVAVTTKWSGSGMLGSGKTREYFYQLR